MGLQKGDCLLLAELGKIYTSHFQGKKQQKELKFVFWKVFKNSVKPIIEFISCNVVDVFYSKSTQKEIGHSKGTWAP